VRAITVCSGFVSTELTAGKDFPMPFIIDANTARRAICDGLERGRTEIVFPVQMALLIKAARLVPVALWSAMWSRLPPRGDS
jgi:short-subunit dehydrogenase